MSLRNLSVPAFALIASLLMACGGGESDSGPTASSTIEPDPLEAALAELTINDLEPLVWQRDDFGTLALQMETTEGSGPVDNAGAAEDLAALGKTAADVDLLGRLGGYELGFEAVEFAAGQIVELNTWVELFDEGADIDAFIDLNIESVSAAATLGDFEVVELVELDVPRLEHSNGWRIVLRYEGLDEPIGLTMGVVQRGRLLGGIQLIEFGDSDRSAEMIGLLEQLDQHIVGALSEVISAS